MDSINDRFTFDRMFRFLLRKNCSREEAKDIIMSKYSLGLLVFLERIENGYYEEISLEVESKDLLELKNEIFNKEFRNFN